MTPAMGTSLLSNRVRPRRHRNQQKHHFLMGRETGRWKLTLVEGLLSQTGSDDLTTRYCTVVRDRKEAHHHRADSTMGCKM
ncbi:hypothetical protein DPMN_084274 [Dreissena polymorpha]|uniref:Uncharacterized protein n=1 Tax=Dreissena polymorpha TaxID=45954 RepID=A0A9D3YE93_DREPO|nr:hypothetical protein DPMN_084274 [Dreissena polymorpha]